MSAESEVERYTSPSRLEAEKRTLFGRLPMIVGRASELPAPATFFTHDASGTALLITRDASGGVHAMANVCGHRGTRLVFEEAGSADAFVCKLHSWKYDLCGVLARPGRVALPPALEQFMDQSALVDFPCATRHGFVWVQPSPRLALDVARWLGDGDAALSGRGLEDLVLLRRTTTTRLASWKLAMVALLGRAGESGRRGESEVRRREERGREKERDDRESEEQGSEGRQLVFPSSMLALHATRGCVVHVALFPVGTSATKVVQSALGRDDDAHCSVWADEATARIDEDLAVAERVQATFGTGDPLPWGIDPGAPSIRAFHDAVDRAVEASLERGE